MPNIFLHPLDCIGIMTMTYWCTHTDWLGIRLNHDAPPISGTAVPLSGSVAPSLSGWWCWPGQSRPSHWCVCPDPWLASVGVWPYWGPFRFSPLLCSGGSAEAVYRWILKQAAPFPCSETSHAESYWSHLAVSGSQSEWQDHCRFSSENFTALQNVNRALVQVCRELALIGGRRVAVDGTFLKACANRSTVHTTGNLTRELVHHFFI